MKINNLQSKSSLLYVPKEFFEGEFKKFNKTKKNFWEGGLLLYAITGVPLVHGQESPDKFYGGSIYDHSVLWVLRKDFNQNEICKFKKNIIIVDNFLNKSNKFSFIRCN